MSVKILQSNKAKNYLLLLRSFSVSKNFDVMMRRGFAKNTGDSGFKALDVCPSNDPSLVAHKSLTPPPEISPCIYRRFKTADEQLGPGADKCGEYKNAEYYGYHNYSYTDILIDILEMQERRKKTGAKPCPPMIPEDDDDDEDEECAIEVKKEPCKAEKKQTPCTPCTPKPKEKPDSNKCGVCMACKVADEKSSKSLSRDDIMGCTSDSELTDDECEPPKEQLKCPQEVLDECGQPITKKKDDDDDC